MGLVIEDNQICKIDQGLLHGTQGEEHLKKLQYHQLEGLKQDLQIAIARGPPTQYQVTPTYVSQYINILSKIPKLTFCAPLALLRLTCPLQHGGRSRTSIKCCASAKILQFIINTTNTYEVCINLIILQVKNIMLKLYQKLLKITKNDINKKQNTCKQMMQNKCIHKPTNRL